MRWGPRWSQSEGGPHALPGGIPNCPPISGLPGHNVVFSVVCDGTMHYGGKCCEHCAELKGSEALKKIVEYAIDATPRNDYLRFGVQQLSELLHKKRDQRDDVRLAALNAHRKIVSLRGVADTASKLVIALRTKNFHRVGPYLEHHMSQGHSLRDCVALLEQAVTPQLLHKYTEQERDLALLTLRLEGRRLLHTFYKAGILPSSAFSKQFQRAENPFTGGSVIPKRRRPPRPCGGGLRWSPKRRRPPPPCGGGPGGPKAKEAPSPMQWGPRWAQSEGGNPAHAAGPWWSPNEGGALARAVGAPVVPKRRRPPRPCGRGLGYPKAKEVPSPMR